MQLSGKLKSIAVEYVHRLRREPVFAWLALLLVAAFYHLALLLSTSAPLELVIFVVVLWAVAWLPIEDLLPILSYKPRSLRVFAFSVLWTVVIIRGWLVESYADPYIALFPLVSLWVLVVLLGGYSSISKFGESFSILLLVPVLAWLPKIVPTGILSESAATFAAFILRTFGVDIGQSGPKLTVGVASVNVAGPCSGNEIMVQALVVALLALIVFPMPRRLLRLPFILVAPLFGWLVNGLRVALLALIASVDPVSSVEDTGLFSFFHLGEGGMIFSGIGIAAYAFLYIKVLDKQLVDIESGS